MKLKIISDGTNAGTKLIDEDTGEMVHLIQKLSWQADAAGHSTKVVIELLNVLVEITTKAEVELSEIAAPSWEAKFSKSFEKEIKIKSEPVKENSFTPFTVIRDAQTDEVIGAIQKIKWKATPKGIKAKIKKIKFDKKDW
jgi:hypothetical protein